MAVFTPLIYFRSIMSLNWTLSISFWNGEDPDPHKYSFLNLNSTIPLHDIYYFRPLPLELLVSFTIDKSYNDKYLFSFLYVCVGFFFFFFWLVSNLWYLLHVAIFTVFFSPFFCFCCQVLICFISIIFWERQVLICDMPYKHSYVIITSRVPVSLIDKASYTRIRGLDLIPTYTKHQVLV